MHLFLPKEIEIVKLEGLNTLASHLQLARPLGLSFIDAWTKGA